jgi:hypothetical protein
MQAPNISQHTFSSVPNEAYNTVHICKYNFWMLYCPLDIITPITIVQYILNTFQTNLIPKKIHFLYSVYYELTASTRFGHYFPILRRRYINDWCKACVLCRLAATSVGVELIPTLVASSRHKTHAVKLLLFMQRLLKMSK